MSLRQLRFIYWSDAPAVVALAAWMLLIGFVAVLGVLFLICPVSAAWGDRAVQLRWLLWLVTRVRNLMPSRNWGIA